MLFRSEGMGDQVIDDLRILLRMFMAEIIAEHAIRLIAVLVFIFPVRVPAFNALVWVIRIVGDEELVHHLEQAVKFHLPQQSADGRTDVAPTDVFPVDVGMDVTVQGIILPQDVHEALQPMRSSD